MGFFKRRESIDAVWSTFATLLEAREIDEGLLVVARDRLRDQQKLRAPERVRVVEVPQLSTALAEPALAAD